MRDNPGLRAWTTFFEVDVLERIAEVAAERRLTKADVARDLLRRGLKDYEAEQEYLRTRSVESVPA